MEIKEIAGTVGARIKGIAGFFKESFLQWLQDNALRQAAALAFYSVFSIAPLLVITIAVAGFFFGEAAVEGEVVAHIEEFVGREGAVLIENMLRQTQLGQGGVGATLLSLGLMFFGALVIFSALQDALNQIWGVQKAPSAGILYSIKRRLFAFVMILIVGILLLLALVASTALTVVEAYWERWFEFDPTFGLWAQADTVVFLLFFTGLFGVVYKFLPDVQMAWRDVWLGAFMTALLFLLGDAVITLYLTYTSVGSVFGAAGTLAVVLTWVYYSWMIILMGAEMTQVWAREHGRGIRPGKNAVFLMDVTKPVGREGIWKHGVWKKKASEEAREEGEGNDGGGEDLDPDDRSV